MKTSHKSKKKCKYRTLEKYSNTFYKNKQNIKTDRHDITAILFKVALNTIKPTNQPIPHEFYPFF